MRSLFKISLLIIFSFQFLLIQSQDSLVAYYPFNGNTNDSSGNGFHGEAINATLTKDRFGEANSAYFFNGVDASILLNNNEPIITSPEFTISAWARMKDRGGGSIDQSPLFQQRDDNSSSSAKSTLIFFAEDQNYTSRLALRSSFSYAGTVVNTNAASPGYYYWHHYVVSLGTNDSIYLYVDGEVVASNKFLQTGDFFTSVDHVSIGNHCYAGGGWRGAFLGDIDEVKIFDVALTPQEIEILTTEVQDDSFTPACALKIRPNPVKDRMVISIDNPKLERCSLRLFDHMGKLLKEVNNITNDELILECNDLQSGLYIIQLIGNKSILCTRKVSIL